MIRVCPDRDAACPHGMDCPFVVDDYQCVPLERREFVAVARIRELKEVLEFYAQRAWDMHQDEPTLLMAEDKGWRALEAIRRKTP